MLQRFFYCIRCKKINRYLQLSLKTWGANKLFFKAKTLIILLIKGSKGEINFIDSIKQMFYIDSFISDEVTLFVLLKTEH